MKLEFDKVEETAKQEFMDKCYWYNEHADTQQVLNFQYIISENTGLGRMVVMECTTLGLKKDITNYSSW